MGNTKREKRKREELQKAGKMVGKRRQKRGFKSTLTPTPKHIPTSPLFSTFTLLYIYTHLRLKYTIKPIIHSTYTNFTLRIQFFS